MQQAELYSPFTSTTQTILNADCLEFTEPNRFHVMLCDPPYSEHVHKNAVSHSPVTGARKRDLGFAHLTPELRQRIAWFASQVQRWSIVYSDIEGLHAWKQDIEMEGEYIRAIPWIRWSMPQLSGDRPTSGCEMLTLAWGQQRGRKSWNGPGNLTHLAHKCLRGEDKHGAEKPLDQALDLVTWFTNPGERVLVPCSGAGTIELACKLLGRSCVGLELHPEWVERARERLCRDTLSERDAERYARWLESQKAAVVDRARREKNTKKVRAKLEAVGG